MTTVDMVGAPNGKITGQTWSQVLISNICDMVVTVVNSKKGGQEGDELVEEGHIQILNSVDACTGQGKYKDMLEDKYAGCNYCILCYRLFNAPQCGEQQRGEAAEHWVTYTPEEITKFIDETCYTKPPFQTVITRTLRLVKEYHTTKKSATHTKPIMVLVCEHCSNFIRKNQTLHAKRERNSDATTMTTLPMHLAIEFIMSGGLTLSPCQKMLTHCIQSLLFRLPSNPILLLKGNEEALMGLNEKLEVIAQYMETFGLEKGESEAKAVGLARWITEGSQHFLTDPDMARKIRRYTESHMDVMDWWKEKVPGDTACRHCVWLPHKKFQKLIDEVVSPNKNNTSYSSVLSHSSPHPEFKIDNVLQDLEEDQVVMDGVTVFCTGCCRVSIISYEYNCLFKKAIQSPVEVHADAYYDKIAKLGKIKRAKRLDAEEKKKHSFTSHHHHRHGGGDESMPVKLLLLG